MQRKAASQEAADLEQRLKGAEEALRRTTKDYILGGLASAWTACSSAGPPSLWRAWTGGVSNYQLVRFPRHAARQQKDAAEAEAAALREQLAEEQRSSAEQLQQEQERAAAEIEHVQQSLESGSEEALQVRSSSCVLS